MARRPLVLALCGALALVVGAATLVQAAVAPRPIMTAREAATAPGNGQRVFIDPFGKYLVLTIGANGVPRLLWSNDGGASWSAVRLKSAFGTDFLGWAVNGALAPDGSVLHFASETVGSRWVIYGHYPIRRDTSNNIVGIGLDASHEGWSSKDMTLDNSRFGRRPSLVLQANGLPAVAWAYDSTDGANMSAIRFVRAKGDPAVEANWGTASGCAARSCGAVRIRNHWVDHLPYTPGVDTLSQAVLLKAPTVAGQSWSDELVILSTSQHDHHLVARRATVSGANYSPWSAAELLYDDVDIRPLWGLELSAVTDALSNRIWFSHSAYDAASGFYQTMLGWLDLAAWANGQPFASRVGLFRPTRFAAEAPDGISVAFDRAANQVYVFVGRDGILYRRWDVATGTGDTTDSVVHSDPGDYVPAAAGNPSLGAGQIPLIWTRQATASSWETWFAQIGP